MTDIPQRAHIVAWFREAANQLTHGRVASTA
jgi:hypothetical protein